LCAVFAVIDYLAVLGISYQFYFDFSILHSALPTFPAQLSAVSDIAVIKCTTL